jgi:hypothetical protein
VSSPWRQNPLHGPSRGHRAKLTPQDRQDIQDRLEAGESPQALALEYKVTAAYIRTHR